MNKQQAHVQQYKKDEVKRLENLIRQYKVVAIADMTNLPSNQLQRMRKTLKSTMIITMTKGSLLKLAIVNSKVQGLEKLLEHIKGMPAIILTNENSFKLSKLLQRSKTKAPAKAGQIAPNNISIPEGPTPFPPGPIIGELGQLGLKTTVIDGKVAVKEGKVVVKEGEIIRSEVANTLTKLGIEPMEVGINLIVAFENNEILKKEVLFIDEVKFMTDVKSSITNVLNLAVYMGYTTKETIKLLITKAYRSTKAVSDKVGDAVFVKETKKEHKQKVEPKFEIPKAEESKEEEKVEFPELKEKVENQKEEKPKSEVKQEGTQNPQDNFKEQEEVAQSILKKLQDDKLAKAQKEASKPRWML